MAITAVAEHSSIMVILVVNKIGQGKKRHRYLKLFDINSYGVYASVLQ